MKRKHIIVYTFESLEDPLIKGLILQYLIELQKGNDAYAFHIFTHEHEGYILNSKQREEKKAELLSENIYWYPIKYLSGNLKLVKKIYNFLHTFFIALKIKLKYKPTAILGFLAIAGGFSYILSKLLNLKLIIYCYEPHSEYMVDFNIWKRNSLKYRLLRKFEFLQIKNSEHLIIPNLHTKTFIEQIRLAGNVTVCPISIDTNEIIFDAEARERIRKSINAGNKQVMIYTGKFGGIYFSSDELFKFFSALYSANSNLFFYIITPNKEEAEKSILKFKLPAEAFFLSEIVSYSELNQHLSAADIGFAGLPSLPSQKYRTPVKTAMYLSCRLPYLVTKEVGDDDLIAETNQVGLVIDNLNENPEIIVKKINRLLDSDSVALKMRCRKLAETTRSTSVATSVLKKIFSEL